MTDFRGYGLVDWDKIGLSSTENLMQYNEQLKVITAHAEEKQRLSDEAKTTQLKEQLAHNLEVEKIRSSSGQVNQDIEKKVASLDKQVANLSLMQEDHSRDITRMSSQASTREENNHVRFNRVTLVFILFFIWQSVLTIFMIKG